MKTYKLQIPDTSDMKIDDIFEVNGEQHVLIDSSELTSDCDGCSLYSWCYDEFADLKMICPKPNTSFRKV